MHGLLLGQTRRYNGTSYDFEWVQGRRLDTVTTGGIHTIMIEYDSNMYIAHNLEGKSEITTPNNNWKEKFICGYYIN